MRRSPFGGLCDVAEDDEVAALASSGCTPSAERSFRVATSGPPRRVDEQWYDAQDLAHAQNGHATCR